jgi:hypothetical protein
MDLAQKNVHRESWRLAAITLIGRLPRLLCGQ